MKQIKLLCTVALLIITVTACSKKDDNSITPVKAVGSNWRGYIGSSYATGINISIVLSNGNVKEYNNDFTTTGLWMTLPNDTANAKMKLQGTYTTSTGSVSGTTNIVINYSYSDGNQNHTCVHTGVIDADGLFMTGTWKDNNIATGTNTVSNFWLTDGM